MLLRPEASVPMTPSTSACGPWLLLASEPPGLLTAVTGTWLPPESKKRTSASWTPFKLGPSTSVSLSSYVTPGGGEGGEGALGGKGALGGEGGGGEGGSRVKILP